MPLNPGFVEPITLTVPGVAPELDGLAVLHISDLHVRRPRARHEDILGAVRETPHDVLALTGDYMVERGDESAAVEVLSLLVRASRARLGVAGVFGNHDTVEFRRRAAALPVRWLNNTAWAPPELPISVLGVDC